MFRGVLNIRRVHRTAAEVWYFESRLMLFGVDENWRQPLAEGEARGVKRVFC